MGGLPNLQTLARALGGEVTGGQVRAPGPGHSPADRSLSIKLDSNAPDGFIVNSFANDDPIVCKDYVREKVGLPAFKPNGRGHPHVSNETVERAVMAAAGMQSRNDKAKGRIVATYGYTDADSKLLYQVVRLEPKAFSQRRPDGNGRWIPKLEERRVLYRWPELLKYPDGTIFICEGEKDADRVAALGSARQLSLAASGLTSASRRLVGGTLLSLKIMTTLAVRRLALLRWHCGSRQRPYG